MELLEVLVLWGRGETQLVVPCLSYIVGVFYKATESHSPNSKGDFNSLVSAMIRNPNAKSAPDDLRRSGPHKGDRMSV